MKFLKSSKARILVATLVGLSSAGCHSARSGPAREGAWDVLAAETGSVAEVDGQPISLARFNALYQERAPRAVSGSPISPEGALRLKAAIAQEMVDDLLVEREAQRRGLIADGGGIAAAMAESGASRLTPGAASSTREQAARNLRDQLAGLGHTQPISESTLLAFFEVTRDQWRGQDLEQVRPEVERRLREELRYDAEQRLISSLRTRASVVSRLPERYPALSARISVNYGLGTRVGDPLTPVVQRGSAIATRVVRLRGP